MRALEVCCALLYVHSSFAIILMGKRELVALLSLSSWCLVIVVWLFIAVSWGCLQFVVVVLPDDHTHYFGTSIVQLVNSSGNAGMANTSKITKVANTGIYE